MERGESRRHCAAGAIAGIVDRGEVGKHHAFQIGDGVIALLRSILLHGDPESRMRVTREEARRPAVRWALRDPDLE